jgi:hypothetical protein
LRSHITETPRVTELAQAPHLTSGLVLSTFDSGAPYHGTNRNTVRMSVSISVKHHHLYLKPEQERKREKKKEKSLSGE